MPIVISIIFQKSSGFEINKKHLSTVTYYSSWIIIYKCSIWASMHANRFYEITNCILCSAMLNYTQHKLKAFIDVLCPCYPKGICMSFNIKGIGVKAKAIWPYRQLYLPEPVSITRSTIYLDQFCLPCPTYVRVYIHYICPTTVLSWKYYPLWITAASNENPFYWKT